MTYLPQRFPRANLIAQLGQLEDRIAHHIAHTTSKMHDAEDRNLAIPAEKLMQRLEALTEVKEQLEAARRTLYYSV
jgi:hypothetical protein